MSQATQPEGEVMRYSLGKSCILLTSYGTCLHVAGSVGDKPGPGSRRVLTRRRKGQWC